VCYPTVLYGIVCNAVYAREFFVPCLNPRRGVDPDPVIPEADQCIEYDDTELDLTDKLQSMMHHVTKDTLTGEGPVVLFKLEGFVDSLLE